ncbi:NifB/NifX family molybdenum-iron cluster-binding protein [Calothrix sp. UHCC 0171]|uniref:NifB/NifX family molybdenum-iron cluster-binding protein n=1 Tax=Calothrix sp. UHCC 0171 TaxID=3110245 RepID=UPI002B1EE27C|nr:NifB/NifX family molybdenum-iron cluster-binding protein [Calothrix sp. UHCC 0171]MEA5574661.1 NifB/NifX family molybdenum-iron cluster-binding protein [Calothrix sp. UHCC 0171]
MKIAVASQNKSSVTDHTGKCRKFWIYDINSSEIVSKELLELSEEQSFHNTSRHHPHPLDGIQVLISGGMGNGLIRRLETQGIEVIITPESEVDCAVNAYLNGSLVRETSESCEHKHEHHHRHNHHHCHKHAHKEKIGVG